MKRLVLFSDGTGNSSAKAQQTNVWRMFQALDQTTPDQLAKYDDGVGTSSNKYLAALGGVFGYGLKRNVIDLYKFVCRNHRPGDEIHGFGFSRGAFTIRVLVGLIATQGLVSAASESELHAMALAAYRQYRIERFPSKSPLVWAGRLIRDLVTWPFNSAERALHQRQRPAPNSVAIRFLGLWDTVGAYAMPIDELKWGLSLLVWPMVAIDRGLFPCVQRACHALALDDQRETFHPTLFDEALESRWVADGSVPAGRLTQVWFAGMHSNVGGGYPEDKASLVPLDWMMSQAIAAGLRFSTDALPQFAEAKSAYARLYDSRAGVGAYYRYSPRRIDLGVDVNDQPILPIVHGSVVMRMAQGSDAYAPISLPARFDVLAPDGQLLPMQGFAARGPAPASRGRLPPSTTAAAAVIKQRTAALQDAIQQMGRPDLELVSQVHDTVWWRRVTYFACLGATLLLVLFPFASTLYAALLQRLFTAFGGAGSALEKGAVGGASAVDELWHGDVQALVDLLKPVAPAYLDRWLLALAEHPLEMAIALVLVAIPFWLGDVLGARIHDRAWFAWHSARACDYLTWIAQSYRRSAIQAGIALGGAALLMALALWRRWQPDAVVALGLALAGLLLALVWRIGMAHRVAMTLAATQAAGGAIELPTPPSLRLARRLRRSTPLVAVYRLLSEKIVPILVALLVLLAGAAVLEHLAYHAVDSAGWLCAPSPTTLEIGAAPTPATTPFSTAQVCWASGLKVVKGRHYTLTLQMTGAWRDRDRPADVAGFGIDSARHLFAAPLKRHWTRNWFTPILRIGAIGSDELALVAVVPQDASASASVASIDFTAPHDGELFMYVNDAMLLPAAWGQYFYANNVGTGRVSARIVALTPAPP